MDINIDEKIKSYSEKIGVSESDFKNKFTEELTIMKEMFKEYSEDINVKKALLACIGYFKSLNRGSGGRLFNAIFFGSGTMYDQYKKERKEATEKGYVNEKNEPLFFDQRFDWRMDKPIPSADADESYAKRLYGVFKLDKTDQWKGGVLYLTGKNKILNGPEYFKEHILKASIKEERLAEEQLYMNSISATRFSKVNDEIVQFDKMVESVLPKNVFKDISYLSQITTDDLPIGLAIAKGTVTKVNLTEDNVKSNLIEVIGLAENMTDEEFKNLDPEAIEPITIWFPKDIELNFGVGSDVMVVVQKSTSTDKEGKTIHNYNGVGIYVLKNTGPENKPKPIQKSEPQQTTDTEVGQKDFWKPQEGGN